jgi:hypothetical protein
MFFIGCGCFKKIKVIMARYVDDRAVDMYRCGSEKLKKNFEALLMSLKALVDSHFQSLISQIVRDYTGEVYGLDEDDDDQFIKLRKQVQKTLRAMNSVFGAIPDDVQAEPQPAPLAIMD